MAHLPGIRTRQEGLIFHRNPRDNEEAKRIVGVCHQLFDRALDQAGEWEGVLALVKDLSSPLAVFRFQDSVTGQTGQVRQLVVGVTARSGEDMLLLRDEGVLAFLNECKRGAPGLELPSSTPQPATLLHWLDGARSYALATSRTLRRPFVKPLISDLVLLWPASADCG